MQFKLFEQGVAQDLLGRLIKRRVIFIADAEEILDPLAEGRDARIMHANAMAAKGLRNRRQQSGAIAAHETQARASIFLGEDDVRCGLMSYT